MTTAIYYDDVLTSIAKDLVLYHLERKDRTEINDEDLMYVFNGLVKKMRDEIHDIFTDYVGYIETHFEEFVRPIGLKQVIENRKIFEKEGTILSWIQYIAKLIMDSLCLDSFSPSDKHQIHKRIITGLVYKIHDKRGT